MTSDPQHCDTPGVTNSRIQTSSLERLCQKGTRFDRAYCNYSPSAGDCIIVENRHQPTSVHLRTSVNKRYRRTVYRIRSEAEFYDLQDDRAKQRNRWSDGRFAAAKAGMTATALKAAFVCQPTRMP